MSRRSPSAVSEDGFRGYNSALFYVVHSISTAENQLTYGRHKKQMSNRVWTLFVLGLALGCESASNRSPTATGMTELKSAPDKSSTVKQSGPPGTVDQLRHEQNGPYAELVARDNPDGMVIVFAPSLHSWLSRAEESKGSALSPTEVTRIRDRAPAIAVTTEQVEKLNADRGYSDIDPENAYDSWQRSKKARRE